MNENPSYYAIIPAEVRYDKRLRANEKLMYGEITCLTQKEGYCYASNNYFASLYDVTPQAVSQWVSNLEKAGYIKLEYVYNGKEIKERRMRLVSTKVEEGINKSLIGYQQKFKENNTSINNIKENNNNKLLLQKKSSQNPTLEEIEEYCKSRKNNIDPKKFYEYYEVNNWKDKEGKQVKNWKQKIITWEGRQIKQVVKIDNTPDWFDKKLEINKASLEEQKEMEKIINNY